MISPCGFVVLRTGYSSCHVGISREGVLYMTKEQKQITGRGNYKHGAYHRNPRLYAVWKTMRARCGNPKHLKFRIYGARGIAVCDEWRDAPNRFIDWAIANGYKPGLQIDRLDNEQGYSPSNCRWTTAKENARNTRRNRFLTIGGATMPVAAWAEVKGINPKRIYYWVARHGEREAARRVAVAGVDD